jgi:hypothetical protein
MYAGIFQFFGIGRQSAWILRKVLGRTELHRIHENTRYHGRTLLPGLLDQRQVPLMQGAHSGNQADNAIFVALPAREFFHPGNSSNDFHEKGVRSGVRSACTLAIKVNEVRGKRLGVQLPEHGGDLSAVVRSVINQMLHRQPQGIGVLAEL